MAFEKIKKTVQDINAWLAFSAKVKPTQAFNHNTIPTAPDYSKLDHWAAHPEKESNVFVSPQGLKPGKSSQLEADVFYVYPTMYFGNENWNASLDHPLVNELMDEVVLPAQASTFNSCCRIFAPRYRQATFYTFLSVKNKGRQAMDLAYEDVEKAFDYYLKHHNNGRPFFIASHSQGTVHAMRLLEQRVEGFHFAKQLVAAYLIGFRFPIQKIGTAFKQLKASESPTDNNCIIAWDTYVEGGKPMHKMDFAEIWHENEWKRRSNRKPLCVNPLSWNRSTELVTADKNLGAIYYELDAGVRLDWSAIVGKEALGIKLKQLSKPQLHQVAARCDEDGFLYISKPENRLFRMSLLPLGNYHNYDIALFYMNMRQNIQERLAAFLEEQ